MSQTVDKAWAVLEPLTDPEIPVITLRELGVLREIREDADGVEVVITPTYSGCPAMGQIEDDVNAALQAAGIHAKVITQLSPAWTTDWISEHAKEKLRAYGIAPPHTTTQSEHIVHLSRKPAALSVACPQCGSNNTTVISQFGSTSCKALYKCLDCREPFDYFKPY
ncbi:1,2-phenylacetyl-CoA epoxidase subunit PaaD [Orrella daihaiensis]|uniref:Phenylacetate-CoA oxygenase subunit PaaJ n=1 Tax=Orrella daihaiensis TaxID=2782176 RepID=A0ABY4ALJ1_9BURK|nr:1,2-phenylacetyl-CoA epoxidase subunit PaaD [Orrella daihaiensis]UOD51148.1 phenylacetate-CoA oxygenase subunit PaaJ [Orrella daihaiensis]